MTSWWRPAPTWCSWVSKSIQWPTCSDCPGKSCSDLRGRYSAGLHQKGCPLPNRPAPARHGHSPARVNIYAMSDYPQQISGEARMAQCRCKVRYPMVEYIHCWKTKTNQFRQGTDVFIGKTGNDLCPVAAILVYPADRRFISLSL